METAFKFSDKEKEPLKVQVEEPIQNQDQKSILDKSITMSIELQKIGTRRKASLSGVEVDADKSLLRLSKEILESKALKNLRKLDTEIRTYVANQCLPSLFRSGVYLIPIPLVNDVDAKLQEFKTKREGLIDEFVAEYNDAKNEAEKRLGSLFDPRNYPPVDQLKTYFGMSVRYVAFSTPSKLREINSAIFQREMQKAQEQVNSATEEIKQLLRVSMSDLVNHLVDRLSAKEDGKAKVFRNSSITRIESFLSSFKDRNICDDKELEVIVGQAKQLLDGVSPEALRESDSLKEKVKRQFEEVKKTLDTMVVSRPKRMISFEDEE